MSEELVPMLDKRVEAGGVIRRRWVRVPKSEVEARLQQGWALPPETPTIKPGRYKLTVHTPDEKNDEQ